MQPKKFWITLIIVVAVVSFVAGNSVPFSLGLFGAKATYSNPCGRAQYLYGLNCTAKDSGVLQLGLQQTAEAIAYCQRIQQVMTTFCR